jgi:hypothetical protein
MMPNNFQQSAKIYQFPLRTRPAAAGSREQATPAMNVGSSRLVRVASSGAWYHEEAIQEAERPARNSVVPIR